MVNTYTYTCGCESYEEKEEVERASMWNLGME